MNYRHHYHAGNFADVMKHAVLVQLVRALQRKDKGFLYLDTHAGRGSYDLAAAHRGDTLERKPEHPDGIGRFGATVIMECGDLSPLLTGRLDGPPNPPFAVHGMAWGGDKSPHSIMAVAPNRPMPSGCSGLRSRVSPRRAAARS